MEMITSVELTDSGVEKFNKFFNAFARENVKREPTLFAMLDKLVDRLAEGNRPFYELGQQYTNTRRPEILDFDNKDLVLHKENV